jgi:hypothetical protein
LEKQNSCWNKVTLKARKASVNPFAQDFGLKTEVHSSKKTARAPIPVHCFSRRIEGAVHLVYAGQPQLTKN